MADKIKTKNITITDDNGTFATFFRRFSGESAYDFDGLSALRRLLSNERAKILHTIKSKKPNSIYSLAKTLKRDFKSVNEDIKLLKSFGFIEIISEKTGKRERSKPILVADSINIRVKL